MSIPKKIHYCWFGGNPLPKMAVKCINSWKKHCPDYEIIEWNEQNFDVMQNAYCKEAYEAKKWAFVTDYARLAILHEQGGVYFDTDVELLKNIDALLENACFMGIERSLLYTEVNTGLGLGAEAGNPLIADMLDDYNGQHFLLPDGTFDITTCTARNTRVLRKHGYCDEDRTQTVAGATIYASEYFSPMEMESGLLKKTKKTYSIHHYGLSWTTEEKRQARKKGLRELKRDRIIYNLKVLPNNILLRVLGKKRYEALKNKVKKGEE